jgi:hypothetical protein
MGAADNIDRTWWPTIQQLAALMHARTQGAAPSVDEIGDTTGATYRGTFDNTTSPTAAQAAWLIELAVGEFLGLAAGHQPCSDTLKMAARTKVILYAAMLGEAGYRPEATGDDATAFEGIRKLWAASAQSLADRIASSCPLAPGDGQVAAGRGLGPAAGLPCFERDAFDDLPVPAMLGRRRPAPRGRGLTLRNPRRV